MCSLLQQEKYYLYFEDDLTRGEEKAYREWTFQKWQAVRELAELEQMRRSLNGH